MKLGIDIDGVICDLVGNMLGELRKKGFYELNYGDVKWKIEDSFEEVSHDDIITLFKDSKTFFDSKPIPMSSFVLNDLKNQGWDIYYISHRPENLFQGTLDWLFHYQFPFAGNLTFAEIKSTACRDMNITFMIEDKPDTILDLKRWGISTLIFDQPWNRIPELKHHSFVRMHIWPQIGNYLSYWRTHRI